MDNVKKDGAPQLEVQEVLDAEPEAGLASGVTMSVRRAEPQVRSEGPGLADGSRRAEELAECVDELREKLAASERTVAELREKVTALTEQNAQCVAQVADLELQNSQLVQLHVATLQLNQRLDRRDVLAAIEEVIINLVGSEQVAIFEVPPGGRTLTLAKAFGVDPTPFAAIPIGEGPIGRVVASGEMFVADTGAMDADRAPDGLTACVPLKLDGLVVGAVAIFRLLEQKQALEPVDIELLGLLSTQGARALYCSAFQETRATVRPRQDFE
jgi:hypothetical protein